MAAAPPATLPVLTPMTSLLGVGAERAALLERLGIRTVGDLLLHRPRRYEDRRHFVTIAGLRERGAVAVRGRIVALGVKYFRKRTRSVFEVILDDGTGRLHCRWWNMPFLEGHFEVGQDWMVFGRMVELRPPTMDHPETERWEPGDDPSLHIDRIVPIYPLTEGLSQRWLRARIGALLEHLAPQLSEPHPEIPRTGLLSRATALRALHFPSEESEAERARERLAFDEFVALQWEIQSRRRRLLSRATGLPCAGDNRLMRPFLSGLGFRLTQAQTTVLREIRQDLGCGRPMRRLLQGDVGSGKTLVAAAAALMTIESGFTAALMAPTEILARQHAARFRAWFEPLGLRIETRTASTRTDPADPGGQADHARTADLTIGTHALIASGFAARRLGLVIIDEQHKFGVAQREALVRKGHYPHLLVMTATPIPRTLALTLYSDLDVSVIDESPPGRGRIRTFVRTRESLDRVWKFVREQLGSGRQAYIVFPRVDDTGLQDVKAVTREAALLEKVLAPFRVGLLHGRLPAAERDRVMSEFRAGTLHALIATLVIEVGVDIPNATVMVIENAELFGLAQLHQLRGRIGRGTHESYCILVAARDSEEIRTRLDVLARSSDGFEIAEADLRLRGPGELLGHAQSGLPRFRFADLTCDRALLERARAAVADHLARQPGQGAG